MKRSCQFSAIPAFSAVLLAAAALQAQVPAPAARSSTPPIRLDAIVATVGDQPITRYELEEAKLAKIQNREAKEPTDSASNAVLDSVTLDDMIQDELLFQKAKELKIDVPDAELTQAVDRQVNQVRSGFPTETEFRNALLKSSMGSPAEYRRYLMDQYRRLQTRDKIIRKLTQDGKLLPVNVTDAEISAAFELSKDFLPKKPATVTFKQIIVAPHATAAAREVARQKAESVLVQLNTGSDFEKTAKRESMDPLTKETGGDLGWARRGNSVPEFERWLFGTPFLASLPPGQLSPVFETTYGFHILRMDRVQPGEAKAHQILITPKIDSADIEQAHKLADSVAKMLRAGVPFDTLAKKYHDYAGKEETSLLVPYPRDSLPVTYQKAFLFHKAGDIPDAFEIPGSANRPEVPKFVVAQLMTVDEGGDRTLAEMREAVRADLAQRGAVRRYIDGLKKQTYVRVRLNDVAAEAAKTIP